MKATVTKILENSLQSLFPKIEANKIQVEYSTDPSRGDLTTNIAMQLAGKLEQQPHKIADQIVSALTKASTGIILKAEVAGPGFINIWLSDKYCSQKLEEISKAGTSWGQSDVGKNKKYLFEHTSPNPNKAMHIGHLRNNVTGMAISNIYEQLGYEVVRDCVDNNRGIAIAKLMWGYLKFARKDEETLIDLTYWVEHQDEWKSPEDTGQRPDRFVDDLYVKGATDYKDNEESMQIVKQMVVNWENEDKPTWKLWSKVLDYSHRGQQLTLKRLGSEWDKVWHEHEHYKTGKDWVQKGLKKSIFVKTDEGTIITNLKKYKLPDTIVIKSDGTALYITQDIALTKIKLDTFQADKLHWVVGPEQSLALKQMFRVCEQLGFAEIEKCVHIPFGYMSIKGQGKMSSRQGNVIYIDDLLDMAVSKIKERLSTDNFTDQEITEISEKLGVGSVKYSILSVGRMTDTAFDVQTSVSLEGNSGPYLIYSYVRACSILKKVKEKAAIPDKDWIPDNQYESGLIKYFAKFPDIVLDAGMTYEPHLVCDYLYNLARIFSVFYEKVPILTEKNSAKRDARLVMVRLFSIIMKNGLKLLGIDVVEKM